MDAVRTFLHVGLYGVLIFFPQTKNFVCYGLLWGLQSRLLRRDSVQLPRQSGERSGGFRGFLKVPEGSDAAAGLVLEGSRRFWRSIHRFRNIPGQHRRWVPHGFWRSIQVSFRKGLVQKPRRVLQGSRLTVPVECRSRSGIWRVLHAACCSNDIVQICTEIIDMKHKKVTHGGHWKSAETNMQLEIVP